MKTIEDWISKPTLSRKPRYSKTKKIRNYNRILKAVRLYYSQFMRDEEDKILDEMDDLLDSLSPDEKDYRVDELSYEIDKIHSLRIGCEFNLMKLLSNGLITIKLLDKSSVKIMYSFGSPWYSYSEKTN